MVVSPSNSLAGIAAARGDLGAASAAYETLLERCRATGQHLYVSFTLLALARLRARQGDDTLADRLYDEAIASGFNPWLSADAMVGQAAVARRLGDLTRARALLDRAEDQYRAADLPAGRPLVLAGLAWWALAAGCPADATVFAAQAASPSGGPGDSTAGQYRRGCSQGDHRPHPSQHQRVPRPRPAARVRSGLPNPYRRARCRRARGPPRAAALPQAKAESYATYWSTGSRQFVSASGHQTYAAIELTGATDTARQSGRPPRPATTTSAGSSRSPCRVLRAAPTLGGPPGSHDHRSHPAPAAAAISTAGSACPAPPAAPCRPRAPARPPARGRPGRAQRQRAAG